MGSSGAPKGNSNGLQSGLYALMKLRKSGKPNGRTSFGKAFARRLNEYVVMYGGDPSPAEMTIMNDTTWVDFYTLSIDMELVGRRLYRRGKVHPLLDVRVKLAAHRRENLKLLGLQRVAKEISWKDSVEAINLEVPRERVETAETEAETEKD